MAWKPQQSPKVLYYYGQTLPLISITFFFIYTRSYQLLYTGAMYIPQKNKKNAVNSPSRMHSAPPYLPFSSNI